MSPLRCLTAIVLVLLFVCLGVSAAQPSGALLPWETLADRQLVERLVAQADAGDSPTALAQAAGERGIAAALVAAEFLDERKPRRLARVWGR